ncbi:MAG: PD40 domain-containing protein [Bacteroidales bacterium]|nr:PD40 domain-containing protein [Bacteroidales bacterium]
MKHSSSRLLAAAFALLLSTMAVAAASSDEARLLRYPGVGGDNIVFTYAGDLFRVGIDGGDAVRLTSHVGFEAFARISPDGKTIAFTGQYDGNTEVYTLPVTGGEPRRITYSALVGRDNVGERMGLNNIVMCWTPDGKEIVYRSKSHNFSGLRGQLCKVPAEGGSRVEIPTSEGGFCSYSPDGKQLAFNRMFRETRTWKYYRGGQADDIWINEVGTNKLKRICENDAQDIFPMWIGDDIYYLSDRDRIMNLFVYHNATGKTEKVTNFKEYDCKYPSFSQKYIVFENGGYIYKYTVKTKKCEKLTIRLCDDVVYSRDEYRNVGNEVYSYAISPDGKRVVMIAHGDLFSLPESTGAVYNVTRTPGAHDREVSWSPDGSTIAYISDRSGEYQIWLAPADDMENAVCATSFKGGYLNSMQWSPDSKTVYFTSEANEMYALDVKAKKVKTILKWDGGGYRGFKVSPDSKWAAYSHALENDFSAIFLMDLASGKSYQVTDKWYSSSNPVFSEDGKYLFFTSSKDINATYSSFEWNASFSSTSSIFVVSLAADTPSLTAISADEYTPSAKPAAKPAAKEEKAAPAKNADKTMKVDIEGIGERISVLPLPSGNYRLFLADFGKLFYTSNGFKALDLKTMKSTDAGKSVPAVLSADHKKALTRSEGKWGIVSFGPAGTGKINEAIPTQDMDMVIDRQAEWKQIFEESWRTYRDYFYVSNMHGANWKAIHDKYAALLPYVRHRHDLTYIIGEMISEVNCGHAYITSGESPEIPRVKTGLLGAKFTRDAATGAYRIDKVYRGADWDASLRSPLNSQGVKAVAGEYITKINGRPAREFVDIFQPLVGKVGKTVALEIASDAKGTGARTVYVKPVGDEAQLAYYEWVQTNVEKVDQLSGGKIGYIHIPDMSREGLLQFARMYYKQFDKKALIIDDRMNGGGNVSPMILERLSQEVYRRSMSRYGRVSNVPDNAFYGPMVCLIDKYSSSDGDLFPYGFRKLGLGKLIGMRSWGGIVGINGSRRYLDGQNMTVPMFTSYSTEGEWIIEGHGVDPDMVVDINPFDDYQGKDAQLEAAVNELLTQLKDWKELPGVPKAPVKN